MRTRTLRLPQVTLTIPGSLIRGCAHGPQVWPWWKLIVVRAVEASHATPDQWTVKWGWNIWFYTRWGSNAIGLYLRRSTS